jgi:hypothetical protein
MTYSLVLSCRSSNDLQEPRDHFSVRVMCQIWNASSFCSFWGDAGLSNSWGVQDVDNSYAPNYLEVYMVLYT